MRVGSAILAFRTADPALSPHADDAARAGSLLGIRRARFVTGRTLARELLGELAPGKTELIARCGRCGSAQHGPIRAVGADVWISVSYAGALVAVAAAPARVGIDIERGTADAQLHLPGLFPGPLSLRQWTRIEAALKADGRGLSVDPSTVEFGSKPLTARLPGSPRVYDLDAPDGHTASLAIANES